MRPHLTLWALGWVAVVTVLVLAGMVLDPVAVPLLTAAAIVTMLLLAGTAPSAVRPAIPFLRPWRRVPLAPVLAEPSAVLEQAHGDGPLGAEAFRGLVCQMEDQELFAAWRQSNAVLDYTHRPDLRAELSALRQAYLDEMERRDPRGFALWLGSSLAQDPERFLTRRRAQELD